MGSILTVLLAAALALTAPAPAAAQAEKRVALVIGNGAYAEAPLKNPVNDARAMAQTLRQRGFDVILRENVGRGAMADAVADFGERLGEGATGLFFFAGHGIQLNGRNYMIPTDARIASEQRVRLETIDVDVVLDQMSAARARVSMVILDACRNNPFERRFRSAGGGLAQINAPEGTLIAYATAPGKVAADGEGANGLYTRELLRALATPGLKVEDVFKQVRVNVSRASNGSQVPWEASSLTGDFYFQPAVAAAPPSPPPAAPPSPPAAGGGAEVSFWETIKNSSDPQDFRDYLAQFPSGTFATLARRRLATLETAASTPRQPPPAALAAAPPPAASAPPPAAATPAPPAASAPTQLTARPSESWPGGKAEFEIELPAGTASTDAFPLTIYVDGEEVTAVGQRYGATPGVCQGRSRLSSAGEIAGFDLRCNIGANRVASGVNFTRTGGRVLIEDGRPVLELKVGRPAGQDVVVRAAAR